MANVIKAGKGGVYVPYLVHVLSLMWSQLKTAANLTDFNTSVIKAFLWGLAAVMKGLQGREQ